MIKKIYILVIFKQYFIKLGKIIILEARDLVGGGGQVTSRTCGFKRQKNSMYIR